MSGSVAEAEKYRDDAVAIKIKNVKKEYKSGDGDEYFIFKYVLENNIDPHRINTQYAKYKSFINGYLEHYRQMLKLQVEEEGLHKSIRRLIKLAVLEAAMEEGKHSVFSEENIQKALISKQYSDELQEKGIRHGGVSKKSRQEKGEKTPRSRSRSRRGRAKKTLRSRSRAARSRSGSKSRKHLLKRVCKELSRSRSRSKRSRSRRGRARNTLRSRSRAARSRSAKSGSRRSKSKKQARSKSRSRSKK